MRLMLVGASLLALSLASCENSTPPSSPEASAEAADWTVSTARQLRAALEKRAAHGLEHKTFPLPDGTDVSRQGPALTRVALAYATALARGAADPTKLHAIYTVPRPAVNLEQGLREALRRNDVDGWLNGLAPQDDEYRKLSEIYLALTEKGRAGDTPTIPELQRSIRPGDTDSRMPLIEKQLAAFGYLDRVEARQDRYASEVVDAVRRLSLIHI